MGTQNLPVRTAASAQVVGNIFLKWHQERSEWDRKGREKEPALSTPDGQKASEMYLGPRVQQNTPSQCQLPLD